jgi:hypothetical protein
MRPLPRLAAIVAAAVLPELHAPRGTPPPDTATHGSLQSHPSTPSPDRDPDDTKALTVAGASGGRVRLAAGKYVSRATVRLSAGTVLECEVPRLCEIEFRGEPGEGRRAFSLEGRGSGLEGLAISVASGPYTSAAKLSAPGTFVRNCVLNHATPHIPAQTSVYIVWASSSGHGELTDVAIEGNEITFRGPAADAVHASQAPNIRIKRNSIHDLRYEGREPIAGGLMRRHFWAIYADPGCAGAVVSSNTIRDVDGGGINFRGDCTSESDVARKITENHIEGVTYAAVAVQCTTAPLVSANWIVRGNYLLYLKDAPGAVVIGNRFQEQRVAASDPNDVMVDVQSTSTSIINNTFGDSGSASVAIRLYRRDALLSGNLFEVNGPPRSVFATSGSDGALIVNNVLSSNSAGSTCAIVLDGSRQNVTSNIIRGGANAVCTTAASSGAVVAGNALAEQHGSAIDDGGRASVIRGNTVTPAPSGTGIALRGRDAIVGNNSIARGSAGLVIRPHATDSLIRDNTVRDITGRTLFDAGTRTSVGGNVIDGQPTEAHGRFEGDGGSLTYSFPHGLRRTPAYISVTAASAAAASPHWVSADAAGITVTFLSPTPKGSANVALTWVALAE